jgi:thioredoxin-related protein
MRPRAAEKVLVAIFLIIAHALLWRGMAADAPTKGRPAVYDEVADGSKQIADALLTARQNNRHVLLQFGANWCVWCLKLHKLFESDELVRDELRKNFVVVLIDRNEDHNKGLAIKYGAKDGYGLPFLVVLDSKGQRLTTKNTDTLEEGNHHSRDKVLAFLREWTPEVFAARQEELRAKPIATTVYDTRTHSRPRQCRLWCLGSVSARRLREGRNQSPDRRRPHGGAYNFSK